MIHYIEYPNPLWNVIHIYYVKIQPPYSRTNTGAIYLARFQRKKSVENHLGSTIDIAPTILRRADIHPNNGVQGRDLLKSEAVPESLLIEIDSPFAADRNNPRTRTVMTSDWRLTIHQGFEWGELYDLANDLGETKNLWTEDAYKERRSNLTELLVRLMMEMQENAPLQTGLS